jgi:hypothetical protein
MSAWPLLVLATEIATAAAAGVLDVQIGTSA